MLLMRILRNIHTFFAVAFIFLLLFTACGKEDNNSDEINLEEVIPMVISNLKVIKKTPQSLVISWEKSEDKEISYFLSFRKKGDADYSVEIKVTGLAHTLHSAIPESSAGLENYDLSYDKQGESQYSADDPTSPQLKQVLTGLDPSTTYQVRVQAKEKDNDYTPSAEIEVETLPAPTAPTGLVLSERTQSSFKLSWTASTVQSGSVDSYHLSYRKKGESDYSAEITTTQLMYVFTGLTAGTTYQVRVKAKDDEGNYSSYTEGEFTTFLPPTTPTGLLISERTQNSFKINWIASVTDPEAAIERYHISYRKQVEVDYTDTTTTQLSHTLNGLTPGTVYKIKIRVKDDQGYYSGYAEIEGETVEIGKPTEPIGLAVSERTQSGFKITWIASSDPGGSISGYYFSYRKKGEADYSAEIATTQLEYTLSGLETATYQVRLRAKDNEGNYSPYAEREFATYAAPTVPTGLSISDRKLEGFKLSWTASTADPESGIEGYYLSYRKKGDSDYSTEVATSRLMHTISGLISGETYEVRLRAKDNEDYYSNYATIDVTIYVAPTTPSGLTVSERGLNSFKLSWNVSTDSDGSVMSYHLSYRKKGESDYSAEITAIQPKYILTPLTEGATYQVRVRAKDNDGNYSQYADIEATTFTVPTTPTEVVVVKVKKGLKITWSASITDAATSIAEYHLSYRKKGDSDYSTEVATSQLMHTISGLISGETYEVRLRAKDNQGYYSEYTQFTGTVVTTFDKTFGESDYEEAYAITTTLDGGYILAGETKSKGAGSYDMWVVKTDASGKKMWDKTYGGSQWDRAHAVMSTADGGFVLVGQNESKGKGSRDMWAIKIDSKGGKVWDKNYGDIHADEAYAITPTKDDGFILVGQTFTSRFSPSRGAGGLDMWIVKIDKKGNKVWDKTFGGRKDDGAYAITPTTDGGYVLAGYTKSQGAGGLDMWVVKIDNKGDKVWDKAFGKSSNDGARSVTATTDGGFIIAGFINSATNRYTYGVKDPSSDIWVVKIDSKGSKVWDKTFGGRYTDDIYAIMPTTDGGFILTGYIGIYDRWTPSNEQNNVWALKIDDKGNKVWDKNYGGKNGDKANAIAPTLDGGFVLAGYTASKGAGSYDMWMIKIDGEGNL